MHAKPKLQSSMGKKQQQGLKTAVLGTRKVVLLSKMPSWVKEPCSVGTSKTHTWITFGCTCQIAVVQVTVRSGATDKGTAEKLAAAVNKQHCGCQPQPESEDTATQSTAREQQLEGALKSAKRKLAQADSAVELTNAKLARSEGAAAARRQVQRIQTTADARRVDIDNGNKEAFTSRNKSNALHAPAQDI